MKALKYSRQRASIIEFLQSRFDHPTADTVYENIRLVYPKISLGTVYRNLSLLAEIGEIIKISTSEGPDRFDANTHPHNHFICKNCHSVIDLEMSDISFIEELAATNFNGQIESHTTHFFGVCEDCLKKENEKKSENGIDKKPEMC